MAVKFEPIPSGFNFIYGNNGSGKTSLLEAIYYLSLGRSFRSSLSSRIIRESAEKFSLFAQIWSHPHQSIPLGIERHQNSELKIRISGKDTHSNAELASLMPIQLINSHCYNLLESPGFRRKFLDWGVFYLKSDFLRIWKQFTRALKQRNAALRGQLSRHELHAWTQELIKTGSQFDQIRRDYVQKLLPYLMETLPLLLPMSDVEIHYQSGWSESVDYQEALDRAMDRDLELGYTQNGPHRADLKMTIRGVPAKDILSRGQQKLFVCAMLLTQGTLLTHCANKKPVYLIDDLSAELDNSSRSNLMALLSKQETQIFVTAVESEALEEVLAHYPTKMFHVEHGLVRNDSNHSE